MKLKKLICLFLGLAVALGSIPFSGATVAARAETLIEMHSPRLHLSSDTYREQETALSATADIDALREYLLKFIMKAQSVIEISSFAVPDSFYEKLSNLIWYSTPEAFNVNSIGFISQNGVLSQMLISYRSFADTESEYKKCHNEFMAAADKLLEGIEDNSALTDESKALLLHDRLCVLSEYSHGRITDVEHTAYGALVNRSAVCQGYAMAYMYLLRRAGIENYYCASEQLNHAWNIVYIDGKPYHVDVTWDDISWGNNAEGVQGAVKHNNFLRSSEGLRSERHTAYDYDTAPSDSRFDNYYWQDSETEFQLAGGKIYYINNKTGKLICASDNKVLADVNDVWNAGGNLYWRGNFSRLSSCGGELFYSLSDSIYKYTIGTKENKKIYAPNLASGFSVFGFTYEDGSLVCDINNEPPFGDISNLYRKKINYNEITHILCGIEVDASHAKAYFIGDSFKSDGIEIRAVFSDGTRELLSEGYRFSGFSSDTAGIKPVTVTYKNFATQFTVTVNTPRVVFSENKIVLTEKGSVSPVVVTEPAGLSVVLKSRDKGISVENGKITAVKAGNFAVTAEIVCNGKTYSAETVVTVLCGHYDTSLHAEIPPTAENVGYTKGIYCNGCKKYISGHTEIPSLSLKFKDSEKAKSDGKNIMTVAGTDTSRLLLQAPQGSYIEDAKGNAQGDVAVGTGCMLVFPDKSAHIIIVYGDVDGDGAVSSSDARLTLRASVGLESYSEASPYYMAANVEPADSISSSDARAILRASVGLEDPGKWLN